MALPALLAEVKRRPGMFLPKVDFDVVVGFLQGWQLSGSGGLLIGFKEWLVVKLGYGNNLTWDGLVLRLAFPQAESPAKLLHEPENQQRAIDATFALLEEFLNERQTHGGLQQIFVKHQLWLQQQDWYGPEHPGYIEITARSPRARKKKERKPA